MERWRVLGNTLSYEKVTSGPSMLFTPAAHALRGAPFGSSGQPYSSSLPSLTTPSVLPSQR